MTSEEESETLANAHAQLLHEEEKKNVGGFFNDFHFGFTAGAEWRRRYGQPNEDKLMKAIRDENQNHLYAAARNATLEKLLKDCKETILALAGQAENRGTQRLLLGEINRIDACLRAVVEKVPPKTT